MLRTHNRTRDDARVLSSHNGTVTARPSLPDAPAGGGRQTRCAMPILTQLFLCLTLPSFAPSVPPTCLGEGSAPTLPQGWVYIDSEGIDVVSGAYHHSPSDLY